MKFISILTILFFLIDGTNDVPDFQFEAADGSIITKENLEEGKPIIIFYFDPEYTSSIDQADFIYWGEEDYVDINILWVSTADHDLNSEFLEDNFSELDLPLIRVVKDTQNKFEDWFGYAEVPTTYVYDNEWKFADRFLRVENTEELLRNIRKDD
ncbi:MAG: hypothetical protein JJ971_14695 [Balneolaceae bacterium]|nr:hypothetical protein [Balneolaceae bacterium]MBO6547646.1 hypothetical protein [Balneolaceae bacterium]MBO6648157.1 hypothetical protein [Balneolaceae bacterium]